jgi:hypothetical protein
MGEYVGGGGVGLCSISSISAEADVWRDDRVRTVESSVSEEFAVEGCEKCETGAEAVWFEKPEKMRLTGSREKESLLMEGMEMEDWEAR